MYESGLDKVCWTQVIIQKYFLHKCSFTNLASCSRVLCTGSDTLSLFYKLRLVFF